MKIAAAILALLILFLTVQPMLPISNVFAKNTTQTLHKCCASEQKIQPLKSEKHKKNNNNCCSNGHCDNPFLSCADCYFINLDKSSFSVAIIFKQTKKIRLTNDKVLSSYIQDFWHPPNSI